MAKSKLIKVWVSLLIPVEGADVYGGARLQVSTTEDECWRDLADWLDRDASREHSGRPSLLSLSGKELIEETRLEMEDAVDNCEIVLWKVEEQEIRP